MSTAQIKRLERQVRELEKAQQRANAENHLLRLLLGLNDEKVKTAAMRVDRVIHFLPFECHNLIRRFADGNPNKKLFYASSSGLWSAEVWLAGLLQALKD